MGTSLKEFNLPQFLLVGWTGNVLFLLFEPLVSDKPQIVIYN